ncbi:MAG: PBP1A family penicillin-binding protein [Eubacteriales bacterium]|nr:PBP1A family penicillin-binding protein [Bacillota bacterium]MBV1726502.1 PBP1A family penicillin-binding protein [Desulforudis sp.]MDQ7789002.1 PBP1A family penicillin-binding protein [Clostridia bacterium]MDZ4044114.1 PBP1A family penicillin-binding protein [Eubacteriales bacterium]MBU4532029.1 PBP1A family penicillin-binding protein [Bacillota bacterium]
MPEKKRRPKKRRQLNILRLTVVLVALAVFIGGGAAFGMLVLSLKDIPAFDVNALQPNNATLIYDQNGELIAEIGIEKRIPISINDVPPHVKKAFLAAEDNSFYQHHGVDIRAIARSVWVNATTGSRVGGSTLTQQLVKNVFLTPDKAYKRKIQEAFLAVQVERHYSKDEIFQMYLNWNFFGEHAYGIQSAASTYFGKSVQELNIEEAAMLAGLLQAPSYYSPYQNYDAATQRRNTVLGMMYRFGHITEEQYEAAKAKPIELSDTTPADRQYPYPYFIDYVTEQLVAKYGEATVFREGLKVYTTLDPKVQDAAEAAFANNNNFPGSTRDGKDTLQPQGAAVFLDPHNGHIKAIVGGREHTQRRQWNRGTRERRQPGSAFKPIIAYGPAIEHLGMGPATIYDDVPIKYPKWEPVNYDGIFRGLVTMRTAVTWSVNMPAIKALEYVTPSRGVDFALKLGFSEKLLDDRHNLAIALGGLTHGVTPLEMAGAYGAFANQGVYIEPTAITMVKNNRGTVIEEIVPIKVRAMKATTAYLITDMLRTVVTQGTGTRARMGNRPVAGKTGTTDKRENIWFAGYTPELVGVVWIGHDDQNKSLPVGAYGGVFGAQIWHEVMTKALAGVPVRNFPQPGGLVTATVDSKSGLLPGPRTPQEHQVSDLFEKGTVPTEMDSSHVLVEICPETGLLASEFCPERITSVRVDVGYEVPDFVNDFSIRLPTKTCDLHDGSILPGFPPFLGDDDDPIPPGNGEPREPWEPQDRNGGNNGRLIPL